MISVVTPCANFALRTAILDERLGRPGKHVDEARSDREPGRIDHIFRFALLEIANRDDAVAANCDIGFPAFRARAVVNRPVANNCHRSFPRTLAARKRP